MLLDRGVKVDHTTIYRWIQAYAVELEKRIRPHLRKSNGSWRVDETYVRVEGRWMCLYRAVDSCGQTNAGRPRGDGDDQERPGSEHQRQRHQDSGRIHRRTVPGDRLRRHLSLSR